MNCVVLISVNFVYVDNLKKKKKKMYQVFKY